MKNAKLLVFSLINSLGVLLYIFIAAVIIQNGEKIFGKMNNLLSPVAFLLLFVFSATATASLVLGRPIWLYLEGKKKEAVILLVYTICWLFLITVVIFAINAFIRL